MPKIGNRVVAQTGLTTLGGTPIVDRNPNLEALWGKVLPTESVGYSDPNRWRPKADVRTSSFPFCPRLYVMERLGLAEKEMFDMKSNMYAEIGKAIHYVLQNGLAKTGRLWGRWSCANPECKRWRKSNSTYPEGKVCKYCKKNHCMTTGRPLWEYEEVRYEDEAIGFRGHTDGILVFKNYSSTLEVKSAGDKKVTMLKGLSPDALVNIFTSEVPWYGYLHQALSYAAFANQEYAKPGLIPPMKYVDFFVQSRDDPFNYVALRVEVPQDLWWNEIRRRVVLAQKALSLRIFPVGFARTNSDLATNPACMYCHGRQKCFSAATLVKNNGDALTSKKARLKIEGE